ncbi:aldo-keto reductase family 4 member C10-like [Iris pallida]|uniref:Aldo-keto reductase family 4 member C10-like n=1 Tax=Iris pallida TaxID=29817 RepID=A0AAX6ELT1_IRIPA|nr:aldo-keto reductase family 4 member C10-like [Iris pallida]
MSAMGPCLSDSGSEDKPGTPRMTFRRLRSVHGPMLKLSIVADITESHMKTPEQDKFIFCSSQSCWSLWMASLSSSFSVR